jgi:hypothetical protein
MAGRERRKIIPQSACAGDFDSESGGSDDILCLGHLGATKAGSKPGSKDQLAGVGQNKTQWGQPARSHCIADSHSTTEAPPSRLAA